VAFWTTDAAGTVTVGGVEAGHRRTIVARIEGSPDCLAAPLHAVAVRLRVGAGETTLSFPFSPALGLPPGMRTGVAPERAEAARALLLRDELSRPIVFGKPVRGKAANGGRTLDGAFDGRLLVARTRGLDGEALLRIGAVPRLGLELVAGDIASPAEPEGTWGREVELVVSPAAPGDPAYVVALVGGCVVCLDAPCCTLFLGLDAGGGKGLALSFPFAGLVHRHEDGVVAEEPLLAGPERTAFETAARAALERLSERYGPRRRRP